MPVSIVHWRVEIEAFILRSFVRVARCIFSVNFRITLAKYLFMLLCEITLPLICGDVEVNPGLQKTKPCYKFSLCHWNLNSITTLEAYNAQHKFDMMCISETYLDLSFPDDHPDLIYQVIIWLEQIILTILREVMFVFTLRSLSLFVRKHKKNAFEVFIHNRKDSVVSLYRSPSHLDHQV